MSITIKDEETCRLANELAEMTGASPGDAIDTALRFAVEQERASQSLIRRMMTDAGCSLAEIETAIKRRLTHEEVDAWMYDEYGAPK